jgi:hypothetical protein
MRRNKTLPFGGIFRTCYAAQWNEITNRNALLVSDSSGPDVIDFSSHETEQKHSAPPLISSPPTSPFRNDKHFDGKKHYNYKGIFRIRVIVYALIFVGVYYFRSGPPIISRRNLNINYMRSTAWSNPGALAAASADMWNNFQDPSMAILSVVSQDQKNTRMGQQSNQDWKKCVLMFSSRLWSGYQYPSTIFLKTANKFFDDQVNLPSTAHEIIRKTIAERSAGIWSGYQDPSSRYLKRSKSAGPNDDSPSTSTIKNSNRLKTIARKFFLRAARIWDVKEKGISKQKSVFVTAQSSGMWHGFKGEHTRFLFLKNR